MNDKESELYRVVDIVVECCRTEIAEGVYSLTRDDVLGKSKNENVCMTRCILVCQLIWAGFTVTTIAELLKRSAHAVRYIYKNNMAYVNSSRAYRLALSEATTRCKDVEPKGL